MLPLTQKNESTGSTTFMEKLYNAFPVEDS